MYKKISMTLLHLGINSRLRFHVNLYDKENEKEDSFHTIYFNEYIHLDLDSYATIEIKDGEWDKSKSIIISNRNIMQLIKGIELVIKNIYKKDTFEIVNGKTVISSQSIQENSVDVYLNRANTVRISPAVIYDIQEDNYYEGAILYLNKGENYIEMHFTLLEALLYQLKQINFVIYANILIRFYLDYIKEHKEGEGKITVNKKGRTNVFEMEVQTVKEETNGNLGHRNSPNIDEFF